MDKLEFFSSNGIETIKIGSGILVDRVNSQGAVRAIFENGLIFFGYDAFKVYPDGKRQPFLEFSASYNKENQPDLERVLAGLENDNEEVTHYEFVFSQFA